MPSAKMIPYHKDGSIMWEWSTWDREQPYDWREAKAFILHARFDRFRVVDGECRQAVMRDSHGREYAVPTIHFADMIPWLSKGDFHGWVMPFRRGNYTSIRRATLNEQREAQGL